MPAVVQGALRAMKQAAPSVAGVLRFIGGQYAPNPALLLVLQELHAAAERVSLSWLVSAISAGTTSCHCCSVCIFVQLFGDKLETWESSASRAGQAKHPKGSATSFSRLVSGQAWVECSRQRGVSSDAQWMGQDQGHVHGCRRRCARTS